MAMMYFIDGEKNTKQTKNTSIEWYFPMQGNDLMACYIDESDMPSIVV